MNSFGKIFRISIFGESHGPSVGIIVDGCPAGMLLEQEDFSADMERRKGGILKGTTPRKEEDMPVFLSGVFNGKTTGAPLCMVFENKNTRSSDYDSARKMPRPGHADFVAGIKAGGHEDYRGGGHYSGRLTVCLVAAGVVAKKMLSISVKDNKKIQCKAEIIEVGGNKNIDIGIQKAIDAGDSVGGIVECRVNGLPIGLGEPFFDSVESLISHAVFSIPAVKAIEFGAGFAAASMWGSEHNDALENAGGKTSSNHAGGITGGLTNGNEVVFRIAVKPTSSTPKEQKSYNIESGEMEKMTVQGRHDLCIALRVPVVLEAVTSCVLADLMLLEQKINRIL